MEIDHLAGTETVQTAIVYEAARCTGCRYCEIACAVWHSGRLEIGKSRIRILTELAGPDARFAAVNCQHCDAPLCASACPSGALAKDERTGWVIGNASACVGCELCSLACPLAVPFYDAELKTAVKCDFCAGDPQCVRHCSSGALRLLPRGEAIRRNRQLYLDGKG